MLNKKSIVSIVEFILEILIVYVLFSFSGVKHLDIYRYAVIFVCMYSLLRMNNHNMLIWQEMKNVLLFYIVFFVITFVVQPLKEVTIGIILSNLFICIGGFFITMIFKRYFHAIFFKKFCDNVLIIGTGHFAQRLSTTCRSNRFALANPVCYIQGDERFTFNQEVVVDDHPIHEFKDLDECLRKYDIDVVTIAVTQATRDDLKIINDALRGKVKIVKFLPQVNSMFTYGSKIEDYDGLLMISNNEEHYNFLEKIIKRIIDIIGGLLGIILLLPVSIIIKILFLMDGDHDSIFFTQNRIGLNGKAIQIFKYRSMVPHAEEVLEELMKINPAIKEEYLTNKKLENDPRITKVGQFIRKTSIDELPQLINVFLGQMSLVGPRPYLFREQEDMGVYYKAIVKAKPGITGMWQVSGRSDLSFQNRLILDEYYCNNWNIWLDFTILVKTYKALITKDGAK